FSELIHLYLGNELYTYQTERFKPFFIVFSLKLFLKKEVLRNFFVKLQKIFFIFLKNAFSN
ncbi:MAG: hypothetical protein IKW18_06640, partial [Clostridia bacterium]|nr:hypothetical protein [Clostridia bacterium]